VSDDGTNGSIHTVISDDDFEVLTKDDFVNDKASITKCSESERPFVAMHGGVLGMVFFGQNEFWFEWYMPEGGSQCYWFNEERWIKPPQDGYCFFVPYHKVLVMHNWNDGDELLVPIKSIKVVAIPPTSASSSSSATSAVKVNKDIHKEVASIMKGSSNKPRRQKNVKIERTPADFLPSSRAGQASEGVTTGGSISSLDDAVHDDNNEDHSNTKKKAGATSSSSSSSSSGSSDGLRVSGPSDRSEALRALTEESSGRGVRGRSGTSEDAQVEKDDNRRFAASWSGMKQAMHWRVEWKDEAKCPTFDHNYYMAPGSGALDLSTSIENLEFFHTQAAMLKHIDRNPWLTYEWKALWPLLQSAGWEQVVVKKNIEYIYMGSDSTSGSETPTNKISGKALGLHRFRSKSALCVFINRFPFLLQDDDVFSDTLVEHGWVKNRGTRFSSPRSTDKKPKSFDIHEIRDMAWLNPAALFVASDISESRLMAALAVHHETARANDVEPDTPSPSKVSHQSASSSVFTTMQLEEFVRDAVNFGDCNATRFVSMLNTLGWNTHSSEILGDDAWYKHEKLTIAPWFHTIAEGKSARGGKPVLGIDAFWATEDIFQFVKKYGSTRPEKGKPIELLVDYRKASWTLDRRIPEVAGDYSWSDRVYLFDMLASAGWERFNVPKSGWPSGSIDGDIFVPAWNAGKLHSGNLFEYDINSDYFCDDNELAAYLVKHGNAQIKGGGRSRRAYVKEEGSLSSSAKNENANKKLTTSKGKSAKVPVSKKPVPKKTPAYAALSSDRSDSPGGDAEERINQLLKAKKKHAFPAVWEILSKELGWKCVYYQKESVHVAPWSGGVIGSNKFQPTPDDEENRSYFYEKERLLSYITKYGPNKQETDATPAEEMGRGQKRKSREFQPGSAVAVTAKKMNKKSGAAAAGCAGKKKAKEEKNSAITDGLNEDELAAMYSSEEEEDSDDGEMDQSSDEEEVSKMKVSEPMPTEMEEAEQEAIEAGIPVFEENFRADATALYKFATGIAELCEGEPWLDVMVYSDVRLRLSARKSWSWGKFKHGEVEQDIIHRIDKKQYVFKPHQLEEYQENVDYFFSEESALEFVHGQLRAFGCHVNKMSWDATQHNGGYDVPNPTTIDADKLWHYIRHDIGDTHQTGHNALLESMPVQAQSP
jgi:hypothetical protein